MKLRLFLSTFSIVLIVMALFCTRSTRAETTTCPTGTRPATAADNVVKNGQITAGTCYNPNDQSIGMSVSDAKAYLNSLPKHPLSNCAPPNQQNIDKLNDTFAVCAAQFFKAYTQKYGNNIYVTSAYRDAASGANACAGGVPGSNHTKGLAMDVYPKNQDWETLWNFASQNPGFGVCFPRPPYKGQMDKPHFILAGIGGGEGARCAAQGVTKACSGSPPLSINYPTASTNLTPISSAASAIQTLFSPQQSAAPAQSSPVSSVPVSQPTQQALTSAYQTPTTQTTSGTTQTSVPVSSSVPASTVLSASNTSGSSGSSNTSSSALDALNAIAYPDLATPTATSATGTLLTLNNALNDQHQGIQTVPGGTPPAASGQVPLAIANQVSELHQPNTFTSPDMNQDFTQQSTANPSSNTFMGTVLDSIQQTLLSMLTVLQPFGTKNLPLTQYGVNMASGD